MILAVIFLYNIGRDAIERQFGVTPLAVNIRPGKSLEHDNGRLAAIAGYGVDRWHYVGTDYTILFSIPEMCPEQFTCHDVALRCFGQCSLSVATPMRRQSKSPGEYCQERSVCTVWRPDRGAVLTALQIIDVGRDRRIWMYSLVQRTQRAG